MFDITMTILVALVAVVIVVSLYPDIQRKYRSETTYNLVESECKRTKLIIRRIHRYIDMSVYGIKHDSRFKNASITRQFDMVLSDVKKSISKEDMAFIKSVEPNIDYYISSHIYRELEYNPTAGKSIISGIFGFPANNQQNDDSEDDADDD